MTPETAAALLAFVDRYGLPILMLGSFLYLVIKRIFVTGRELAASEARYERERLDRIAAEAIVAKFGSANVEVADAVREALTVVVRKDPYAERLAGSARRGG